MKDKKQEKMHSNCYATRSSSVIDIAQQLVQDFKYANA